MAEYTDAVFYLFSRNTETLTNNRKIHQNLQSIPKKCDQKNKTVKKAF